MSQDMLGISVHDAQGVVTDLLEKLGGSKGQEWLKAQKKFLRKENPWTEKPPTSNESSYAITVDYDLTLKGMIRRGAYDYANSDITEEHFPVEGEGEQKLTIEVVHFDVVMTSERVIEELEQRGLHPATLPELLALGASYPELQREFPIVALGSDWRIRSGFRRIPYLWSGGHERDLCLYWFGVGWDSDNRFATVRTES